MNQSDREKNIKRIHQENISRLKRGQKISANFNQQDVNSLGYLSSNKHHDTVSMIRTGSYSSNPPGSGIGKALGPSQYYTISDPEIQNKINNLTKSTIRRIRIENFFSWIFLLILILFILLFIILLAIIASLSAEIIEYIVVV